MSFQGADALRRRTTHFVGDDCPGGHHRPYTITDAFGRVYPLDHVLGSVGSGWSKIVQRLIRDLFSLGWDGSLHQIKEKFGGLRFYIGGGLDAVLGRIEQAEAESLETCEECGEPGTPTREGWISTLCPVCHRWLGRVHQADEQAGLISRELWNLQAVGRTLLDFMAENLWEFGPHDHESEHHRKLAELVKWKP